MKYASVEKCNTGWCVPSKKCEDCAHQPLPEDDTDGKFEDEL